MSLYSTDLLSDYGFVTSSGRMDVNSELKTRRKEPVVACLVLHIVGRVSSVGIATRYGQDGPGIESRWEARFSVPVQTGPGAHPASYTMDIGSFVGVKRPRRGVDHPPSSSAEGKERVGLYLYSPFGRS